MRRCSSARASTGNDEPPRMTRPFALRALAALGAFSFSPNAARSAPTVPSVDSVFSDPANPIEVVQGQLFLIAQASNPSTGYHWNVSLPAGSAVVTFKGSVYRAGCTGVVGAPGEQLFVFEANAAGDATITLDYVAPGNSTVVGKTAAFKVSAKTP